MALLIDLALAAVVTLTLGIVTILQASSLGGAFLPMVGASLLAGGLVILKRRGARGIPIAAIYAVLMFGVLVYIAFVVAWRRGTVEF